GFPRFKAGRLGSSSSVGTATGGAELAEGAGLAGDAVVFVVSDAVAFSEPERRKTGGRSDSGSGGFAWSTSFFAAAAASCSADFQVPSPIQFDPARAAPVTVNNPCDTPFFTASQTVPVSSAIGTGAASYAPPS